MRERGSRRHGKPQREQSRETFKIFPDKRDVKTHPAIALQAIIFPSPNSHPTFDDMLLQLGPHAQTSRAGSGIAGDDIRMTPSRVDKQLSESKDFLDRSWVSTTSGCHCWNVRIGLVGCKGRGLGVEFEIQDGLLLLVYDGDFGVAVVVGVGVGADIGGCGVVDLAIDRYRDKADVPL
jgi:hypothetical protein